MRHHSVLLAKEQERIDRLAHGAANPRPRPPEDEVNQMNMVKLKKALKARGLALEDEAVEEEVTKSSNHSAPVMAHTRVTKLYVV